VGGSFAKANVHFHTLVPDGVWQEDRTRDGHDEPQEREARRRGQADPGRGTAEVRSRANEEARGDQDGEQLDSKLGVLAHEAVTLVDLAQKKPLATLPAPPAYDQTLGSNVAIRRAALAPVLCCHARADHPGAWQTRRDETLMQPRVVVLESGFRGLDIFRVPHRAMPTYESEKFAERYKSTGLRDLDPNIVGPRRHREGTDPRLVARPGNPSWRPRGS